MAEFQPRKLKLKIGSGDVSLEVATLEWTNKAADFSTFGDAATGGRRVHSLHIVAAQKSDTGSLWSQVLAAAGTTVAVVLNPHGVTTATATTPFYNANATIMWPDGTVLGGAQSPDASARWTIDVTWPLDAAPTAVTTGTF